MHKNIMKKILFYVENAVEICYNKNPNKTTPNSKKEGLNYDYHQKLKRQLQGSMLPVRIHSDQALLFWPLVCRMSGACSSPSLWRSLWSSWLHRLHHVYIINPLSQSLKASWSICALTGTITEQLQQLPIRLNSIPAAVICHLRLFFRDSSIMRWYQG